MSKLNVDEMGWFALLVHGLRIILNTMFKATQKVEKILDSTDGYVDAIDSTGQTLKAMSDNNRDDVLLKGKAQRVKDMEALKNQFPDIDFDKMGSDMGIATISEYK